MKRFFVALLYTISLFLFFTACNCQKDKEQYLIVLSVDGFRWDYPDLYSTPNLDSMAMEGVKASAMQSCFPTKTFPNHYSMATGLYPDHHGLILNSFYADDIGGRYSIGDRHSVQDPAYYGGEPIWVTAEKQGLKAASYYWVGSEALHPSIWKNYDESLAFSSRIDSVFAWLSLPEKQRPRLIMWYMHEPDKISHKYGPKSVETKMEVERIDSLLGVFRHKLRHHPLASKINFVVVSDHGMCEISPERLIRIDSLIPEHWIERRSGDDVVVNIAPAKAYSDSVYLKLKKVQHILVWRKNEIPARLHFGSNSRIDEIVILADSSWNIGFSTHKNYLSGGHGFDNRNTDMDGIFYAYGPAFKKAYQQPKFINIELYNIFAKVLGLKPAENDGNIENVKGVFAN
ncbi:MAG: ectonucleotide pyrophosphatase/phosphodiesterase [Bacteroidales bacterium]|nr:ectonucleotide pyrophosphatase/phosphodiesterase [Bacteroidales bacterium]